MAQDYKDQFSYEKFPINQILNSMNEGIILYDHENKILVYNQSVLKVLGLTEAELYHIEWFEKRTVSEDMTPVSSDYYPSIIALKTGRPQLNAIFGVYQKTGDLKWVSVDAIPLFNSSRGRLSETIVTFTDITAEKRNHENLLSIQKQLETSHSFLNNILDSVPVRIACIDTNYVFRYVNEEYKRFFNLEKEQILGHKFSDIIGDEIFQVYQPYIQKSLQGEVHHFRRKLHFKHLGERDTDVIFKPDVTIDGIRGFFAIINDVSEISSVLEEIRQKEEEQTKILDSIDAYLGHWNRNLINIHSNRAYAELFKTDLQKIRGSHMQDVYGPETFEKSKPHVEEVLKGKSQIFEREAINPQGEKRYVMVHYLPEIRHGEVIGFFVVGVDVTNLKRSESKFKNLLELAPDPTIILNDQGIIEMVNNQTKVQWGYSKEDLVGSSFKKFLPERFQPVLDHFYEDYVKSPSIKTIGKKFDLWARKKDGSEFPFEASLGPLQTEGKVLFKCVIRDNSERLQYAKEREILLQKESKARLQAEEATSKRDEMLAIVSHDLRNPLGVIVGNIDMLMKKRCGDEELLQRLGKMKLSSKSMLNMINDLLDIYKIEEGKFDIKAEKEILNAGKLVYDICAFQELLITEKGLTLETDIESKLPDISVNINLIQRVFQNLIGNSLKFTPSGGTIKLTAKVTNSWVVFSVEDNGAGIENDLKPHIFDRFAQARETAHLGAGLGLSICKSIIEAYGGHIWLESEVGKGSRFFFSLPIYKTTEVHSIH